MWWYSYQPWSLQQHFPSIKFTLNIRAVLNPVKYTAIADLAESHQIDLFALTETWITSSSSSSDLFNATPPGFTGFYHWFLSNKNIESKSLLSMFASFFSDKVLKIHSALKSRVTHPHTEPIHIPSNPTFFSPATGEEIYKLVSHLTLSVTLILYLPLFWNNSYLHFFPTITNIVNLSLSSGVLRSGVFPKQFKLCSVIPFLKKYNLHKEELSTYRPISHLSFLSKLTERVVKLRLTHHLSSNDLLNSFQSAYTKCHFTECTLLH